MGERFFPERRRIGGVDGGAVLLEQPRRAAAVAVTSLVTSPFTVSGIAPEIRWAETDQTDPAGRYRTIVEDDVWKLQRALTAAFATVQDIIKADGTNIELHLADTGILKIFEDGTQNLQIFENALKHVGGATWQITSKTRDISFTPQTDASQPTPITTFNSRLHAKQASNSGTNSPLNAEQQHGSSNYTEMRWPLQVIHNPQSSGGGTGVGIKFKQTTATVRPTLVSDATVIGTIEYMWTATTHNIRTSDTILYVVIGGTKTELLRLDGSQGVIVVPGFSLTPTTELTISSGAITLTQGHHTIDTEADAVNDDLDTINGGAAGEIIYILPADDARTVRIRSDVDNIHLKHRESTRDYNFNSPSGASGIFYVAGFYDWPATDANLTQASLTVAHGGANVSKAAHAGLVAGGAGSTNTGTVSIVVSGTSIDDEGNRSAADSETLVADITAMSLNQFFSTIKKWLGTITYTLTGAGGASTFNADFNYGFCKYEDFGNEDFVVHFFSAVGLAGGTDSGFNVRLLHHSPTGWTYAATGFVPGGTALANMNTDHSTEQNLVSGEPFAYKRVDLNTEIDGNDSQGLVVEITTGANRAVEAMDVHIAVTTEPRFAYLSTTKQHLVFMKHGTDWLEL